MVNDAEKYKSEDEAAAARISAKNGLESYSYSLRNSVEGDLADKMDAADKEKLLASVKETTEWLDGAAEASKEEYEEKQRELEQVANPIMQKVYAAAGAGAGGMPGMGGMGGMPGAGGMPGGAPGAGGASDPDPTIEEVD